MAHRHSFSHGHKNHSESDPMDIVSTSKAMDVHRSRAYSLPPPKYELDPGAGLLERPCSVYIPHQHGSLGGHLQYDDSDFANRSVESAPPETLVGQLEVDAAIVDSQLQEKLDKHTVYKIAVRCGIRSWSVYRRYRDFVALNDQVRRRFVCFQLHLPPKRVFRSNFDADFVNRRQKQLQQYLTNLLELKATQKCPAVAKFFRLDNPPSADEDLDASRAYCRQLSETISMQSSRLALVDDNLKSVLGQLEESNQYNLQLERELDQLKIASRDKEKTLTEKLKLCEDQLSACMERERQLRHEYDHVTSEAKREREAELRVRKLCQEKQELAVRELLMQYEETQTEIKRRIDISMSPLLASTSEPAHTTDWPAIIRELENTLGQAEVLMKSYHEKVVEGLQSEIQILKSDLAKNEYRLKIVESDATKWKSDFQKTDTRLKQTMKDSKMDKEENLCEIRKQKDAREVIEERYFHHLVLLLKMTMLSDPKINHYKLNVIDAKILYSQARQRSVPVDEWPVWILGQVRGYA